MIDLVPNLVTEIKKAIAIVMINKESLLLLSLHFRGTGGDQFLNK